MTNPAIQQAKTPHKNIQHNHHTNTLFAYSLKNGKQQHLYLQHIQLNTQIIKDITAKQANIIYTANLSKYSNPFPLPVFFAIFIKGCYIIKN